MCDRSDREGQEAGVVVRGTWCLVFIVRGTGRRWRIAGGGGTRGDMVSLHPGAAFVEWCLKGGQRGNRSARRL